MFSLLDCVLSHKWLFASIVPCFLYFAGYAIYNLYFSPLAKIPGPFLAKISAWPNFYYTAKGYRHIWIWQCHEIYGDAFRFKPDGVLFNTGSAFRTIYQAKGNNVVRGNFFNCFPQSEKEINTLTTIDKEGHARKRKVLNQAFSAESVRSAEEFVIKHVDRWVELLTATNTSEWSEPRNMSDIIDQLVFDIMGDLAFGRSFDTKEPGPNAFRHMPHTMVSWLQMAYPLGQSPFLNLFLWLRPRGLGALMEHATPADVKAHLDFVATSVAQRVKEEELLKKSGGTNGRKDMMHYLFNTTNDDGTPGYTIQELNAEAGLLSIAGTDTTSITMAGFWFYLLRNPRVYSKLVEEVRTTFKSGDEIKTGPTLTSCKYLQACIDEALRIAPAGVSESQREVLAGGLNIDGHYIPEGFVVGVPGWAIMHKQEIYGDPWVFRPERWIEDPKTGVTAEDVARAQSAFYPFHIGPMNCVGQKLAMAELLIATAKTLFHVDVQRIPGDTLGAGSPELGWGLRDPNQIALQDAFVAVRTGPMVQFRKRRF